MSYKKRGMAVSNYTIRTIHSPGNNYVVGIGASAGGLEAINDLVETRLLIQAFFIIIPTSISGPQSLMGELLSKHTEMQVFEAKEGMALKPDSITSFRRVSLLL